LFHVAQQHDLDIHPRALRAVTQSLRLIDARLRENPEANRLFLEMLTSKKDPETTLRRMNEAGVFGKFIPDFGRVVAQMQYDMYHVYTVDEHTLFAIGILHKIETGKLKEELPVASEIMPSIASRRALYLATLLHDIAKGRGGDHSVLGEQVALKLGPRLDFTAEPFANFTSRGYPCYWISLEAETHARHARLMREADASGAPLTVEKRIDKARAVTEISLYTADHPGLFSRIAGALAVSGANIVDAKIVTMSNGMALDTLWVQDQEGGPFARPDKLAKLAFTFENVLTGDLKPHIELERPQPFPSRTRVFTVPPRVLIDNGASRSHTVIEVNGRDRPGLLYEV